MFKKTITGLLALGIVGSACAVALANSPSPQIMGYSITIDSFDWGPGVSYLHLHTDLPVAQVSVDDFSVVFNRLPGFLFPGAPTTAISQSAIVESATVTDGVITLGLHIHPQTGVNPFTFTLSPMGNDWSEPFYPVITWYNQPGFIPPAFAMLGPSAPSFTPELINTYLPIVDDFMLAGTFTYADVTLQYAHFVPTGTATDIPLIIWLHGAGEGSQNNTAGSEVVLLGNRVTQLAAPEIQAYMGVGGAQVFTPQAPTVWLQGTSVWGQGGYGYIGNYEAALLAMIDEFVANTPYIDKQRIYIGGCSNGGYMVMRLLIERPELFAAAFPICLVYPEAWLTDEKIAILAQIPQWFVHDINDPTTPHADSQRFFDLLRAAGGEQIHLTTTDGLFSAEHLDAQGDPWQFDAHWSWIPALNNTITQTIDGQEVSLFEWLAQQVRP